VSKPRVFIVHRWDGSPSEGWYPWMKERLQADGCTVRVLKMPHPKKPTIRDWVGTLQEAVKKPNDRTFLLGHSIGCQTIMRYLETLSKGEGVGGALFVAPWFTLKGLETNEDREIARPWIETPIDTKDVASHVRSIFALFSNDDPYVPISNVAQFEQRLNAWTRTERKAGHFSGEDGADQLPQALAALREMMQNPQM
jgi:predicted alpha/beta hydrolase family esterase